MVDNYGLPPLSDLLERLPWYKDLTAAHRREMSDSLDGMMSDNPTKDQYDLVLEYWANIAHVDLKWARLELLREAGLLSQTYRDTNT
jgi:hypothetical protein